MAELKPCPFCGGEAFVDVHSFWNEETQDFTDHTYGVGCEVCLVKTVSFYNTEEEAIEAWNRRTTIETNIFDKEETYTDCTVQVLTNTATGEVSVGWWKNQTSEIDYDYEAEDD